MRPVSEDEMQQLEHVMQAARTGTLAVMTVRNKINNMDEAVLVCSDGLDITPLAILKSTDDLVKLYDPGEGVEVLDRQHTTGASTPQV